MAPLHIDKPLGRFGTVAVVVLASICPLCCAADSPKLDLEQIKMQFRAKLDALRAEYGFPGATAAFILDDGRYAAVATGDTGTP